MRSLITSACVFAAAMANDVRKSFQELCLEHNYRSESYTVTTQDGYVSQMYRIPGKFSEMSSPESKPAVVLMHGWLCDFKFWTANEFELSPAFILAEAGYDVWLPNNRGDRFARAHTSLSVDEKDFWDIQCVKMGVSETPDFIDFVKGKTGQSKVTYVGHSRGNCQAFAGASIDPDYWEENVNLIVALAPIANLYNVTSDVLKKASHYWREIQLAALHYNVYNVLDVNWWEREAEIQFCKHAMGVCEEIIRLAADSDTSVDNMDRLSEFLYDFPAGSSYEDIIYWLQDFSDDSFKQFDYGPLENRQKYGSATPPNIPIEDIKTPIAMASGSLDMLASPLNVDWLVDQFNSSTAMGGESPLVWHQEYELGHLSFTLAKNMTWFSQDVMNVINQYATNDASSVLQ